MCNDFASWGLSLYHNNKTKQPYGFLISFWKKIHLWGWGSHGRWVFEEERKYEEQAYNLWGRVSSPSEIPCENTHPWAGALAGMGN